MRPPRILILVLFLASSFFLIGRAITSATRPSLSAHRTSPPATPDKKSVWGFVYYNTPFSLFPPNAAISLTDDNSTSFAARPAAFGPKLAAAGLSGELWVGSGFAEDTVDGDGELGCSDLPGWDGRDMRKPPKNTLGTITEPRVTSARRRPSRIDRSGRDPLLDGDTRASIRNTRKSADHTGRDGTDDHLHRDTVPGSSLDSPPSTSHADIQSIQESAEIEGKVVLLMRGGCGFLEKVMWAQRRGAVAVIVGDNQKGGPLIQMFAHGEDVDNVTIPSVFTARTTAQILSSLTQPGSFIEDVLDDNGKPTLKVQQGSKQNGSKTKRSIGATSRREPAGEQKRFTSPSSTQKQTRTEVINEASGLRKRGWLARLFSWRQPSRGLDENSRPPSSGRLDWVLVEDWDEEKDKAIQASMGSSKKEPTPPNDDFVIGVHDWRDPDLRGKPRSDESARGKALEEIASRGGMSLFTLGTHKSSEPLPKGPGDGGQQNGSPGPKRKGLDLVEAVFGTRGGDSTPSDETSAGGDKDTDDIPVVESKYEPHDGLWVTITPTSSASPFFDTLLVLVISPLVTLTVVYALLVIRVRIRRRQWRAPKSVVDRLPVRTYHTVAASGTPTPRQPSPSSTSPTTPLLQSTTPRSRPRSRTATGVPESDNLLSSSSSLPPSRAPSRTGARDEREKANRGISSEWRRYMGRQVECVVCLEEYVDGVSRVMSLPCGHEFHADCITPWLTTRRRTCPICKGDVVRSLAHASASNDRYGTYHDDSDEEDEGEPSSRPANDEADLERGILSPEPGETGLAENQQRGGWMRLWTNHYSSRANTQSPRGDQNR